MGGALRYLLRFVINATSPKLKLSWEALLSCPCRPVELLVATRAVNRCRRLARRATVPYASRRSERRKVRHRQRLRDRRPATMLHGGNVSLASVSANIKVIGRDGSR